MNYYMNYQIQLQTNMQMEEFIEICIKFLQNNKITVSR